MALIDFEQNGSVAILKMNAGENRLNPQFIDELAKNLDQVVREKPVTSLVLTSTDPKYWMLGIDLNWFTQCINNRNSGELIDFYHGLDDVLKTILRYPIPVIAAITGHCYGSGAVLAAACDFRFMRADWGLFCLPQVDLDIQFSPGTIALLTHKFPMPNVEGLLLTGKRMTAHELEQHLLIIKQCRDTETTYEEALAFAQGLDKGRETYAGIKQMLSRPVIQKMETQNQEFYQAHFGVL